MTSISLFNYAAAGKKARYPKSVRIAAISVLLLLVTGLLSRYAAMATEHAQASGSTGTVYFIMSIDTEAGSFSALTNIRHPSIIPRLTDYDTRNSDGVISKVMKPSFRETYRDSFGVPVRLTWFVLSMEPYCASVDADCNVIYSALVDGIPGQPGLEGWQKQLSQYGDAIELHYHHADWTDFNNDGIYHWSQLLYFDDSNEYIIRKMLNHLLIDKNFFPSSYRSGWTWEDNGLSQFLEKWIPFDFSNLSPLKHTDNIEPIENVYDWSRAPVERTFYHPSDTDYQTFGNMSRVMLRCTPGTFSAGENDLIFQQALTTDRFVCCYTHVDYGLLTAIAACHQLLQTGSATYGVPFKFITADEAARLYWGFNDTIPPNLSVTKNADTLVVESDEDIYQQRPYVAVKYPNGTYSDIDIAVGENAHSWVYDNQPNEDEPCMMVAAATDRAGNVGTVRYRLYLPGDVNDNNHINVVDITYLVNWLFRDGTPPVPYGSGDLNTDGDINIIDLTYLVDYLFRGGEPPPCHELI
jgi:hypothetical protein